MVALEFPTGHNHIFILRLSYPAFLGLKGHPYSSFQAPLDDERPQIQEIEAGSTTSLVQKSSLSRWRCIARIFSGPTRRMHPQGLLPMLRSWIPWNLIPRSSGARNARLTCWLFLLWLCAIYWVSGFLRPVPSLPFINSFQFYSSNRTTLQYVAIFGICTDLHRTKPDYLAFQHLLLRVDIFVHFRSSLHLILHLDSLPELYQPIYWCRSFPSTKTSQPIYSCGYCSSHGPSG